jgi:GNAT acetyltransferase-like protein
LDRAHTSFNGRAIARLLKAVPSCLPALVSAGSAVLDAYASFLNDCAQFADRAARVAQCSLTAPTPPLSWLLHTPVEIPRHFGEVPMTPAWLDDVRSLRGSVLFENGRRPRFRTEDRGLFDADRIDLYSHHILAYNGPSLVGCVRVYWPGVSGPPCVTEETVGERVFSEILERLGVQRAHTVEIGRWVVHPRYRANGRTGTNLAAAAAALALRLGNGSVAQRGMVICAVGTGDEQDCMLARIGLAAVPGVECVASEHFNDDVRLMYCLGTHQLNPQFLRIMSDMATRLSSIAVRPDAMARR